MNHVLNASDHMFGPTPYFVTIASILYLVICVMFRQLSRDEKTVSFVQHVSESKIFFGFLLSSLFEQSLRNCKIRRKSI